MERSHVKQAFLEWSEGALNEQERRRVESHLKDCPDCRAYFQQMDNALQEPDHSIFPQLKPDPFLPTRIKALAKERAGKKDFSSRWGIGTLRWVLSTGLLVLALGLGIYLGKGLATGETTGSADLANDYYQAFTPQTYSESWAYLLEDSEGDEQ